MTISADTHACIGAGLCATMSPETFDLADDGTVVVIDDASDASPAVREQVDQAIAVCPAQALRWV